MSNYFIVDDETGHNYGSKFNSLSKSNEDRDISDSKFVTNIRLGRITFNRPIADWDSLLCRNDSTNIKNGRSCSKSRFCCTKQRCKSYSLYCLMSILPCINTLLHYNWRSDLLKDICGGLTIGVMNIPQGMAYSLLAGLPPVYGLYVSFLSPLFYAIFGRCAQLSMGTFAVISLLIAGPIEQFSSKVELHYRNSIINTNFTNADLTMDDKLKLSVEPRLLVAITLTFLLELCSLSLGSVNWLLKSTKDLDLFFLVYVNLFKNIRDTNLITLLISCVSIVFLITTKYFIEPLLRRYVHFNFPIPSELVVIALGTVTSAALNLHSTNNVSIVGHIASGMPQLTVPYWPVVPELIGDAILITLVSTFLSISLVKLFSMKYGDKINFNHEILSFGIMNTITAFFSCSVQSGSLSRSMVLEGTRSRTPLSGVVTTPSVLFLVTFLSTVVLDVTYGLMVGLVACVFALSEKQRSVKLLELQNVPGTELYVRKHFELLTNTQINKTQYDYLSSSIKSVRVLGSLNFSSFENFTSSIYKVIDHMAVECERFNQSIKLSSGESDSLTINITKNSPLDNGIPQNECLNIARLA
ncbi:unnamed protein product [Heterobilharzia americana]|nr:unnamed protein product [Heterobilharzia americana]